MFAELLCNYILMIREGREMDSRDFQLRNWNEKNTGNETVVTRARFNANARLKINREVYFSTPKCFSTLTFAETLHQRKSILENQNKMD